MKRFKYDVIKLIEAVRDRPCLWNKKLEIYKDRVERKIAWEEIFHMLDERYEMMTPENKRLTSEVVQTKWTNIRDTFIKTLKNRVGKARKQYVLYDNLKFLFDRDDQSKPGSDQDNLGYSDPTSFMKDEDQTEEYCIYSKPTFEVSFESEASASAEDIVEHVKLPRKRTKRERMSEEPNIDFVAVDPVNDPRIMNEDEAFFASLLPTVVKYNEDERLEFRIEVLSLMRKIKDKRKWSSDLIGDVIE